MTRSYTMVITVVAMLMIGLITVTALVVIGQVRAEHNGPVCHSVTEDSPILDCDYHDGGWYRK